MRAIRRSDTRMEVAVRSLLHRSGLRFRKDLVVLAAGMRVRPDIVFTRARVAVFVDGCYWHRCPEHGRLPKRNLDYWLPKLARNEERDRASDQALAEDGWEVVRVWEHQEPAAAAAAIAVRLHAGGAPMGETRTQTPSDRR